MPPAEEGPGQEQPKSENARGGHDNDNDIDGTVILGGEAGNDPSPPPDARDTAAAASGGSGEESAATTAAAIQHVASSPGDKVGLAIPETDSTIVDAAASEQGLPDAESELQRLREMARKHEEEKRKLKEQNEKQAKQLQEQSQKLLDVDTKNEEQAKQLQEQSQKLLDVDTKNKEQAKQLKESEDRNQTLRTVADSLYSQKVHLTVLLRGATEVLPLWVQLLLLFLTGFFGYEAPIWLNLDKALKWMGCRTPEPSDEPAPAGKLLVKFIVRFGFFFLMFLVDFSDAIVDFSISIQEILGLSSDDDGDTPLVGWAIHYFLATAVGRTLGGLLALFYHRIEKEDQEITYLLVELTILAVEDTAAMIFITVKERYGFELTRMDQINWFLSLTCIILFLVPTLFKYKVLAKALPRPMARFIFTVYVLFILWCIINLVGWNDRFSATLSDKQFDNYERIKYAIYTLPQFFILFYWVHYLHKKEKARKQQLAAGGSSSLNSSSLLKVGGLGVGGLSSSMGNGMSSLGSRSSRLFTVSEPGEPIPVAGEASPSV